MERTGTESQGPGKTKLLCNENTSLPLLSGIWNGMDDTLVVYGIQLAT